MLIYLDVLIKICWW